MFWQLLCCGQLLFIISMWWMEQHFLNLYFLYLIYWKIFLDGRICYYNRIHILWVCVDIIQYIFSALMEAENISQKSVWLHFLKSIIKTIIKTHILQQMVSIHMHNFIHIFNIHIFIPSLDLKNIYCNVQSIIYLFQFTNNIGICINCFLVLLSDYTVV